MNPLIPVLLLMLLKRSETAAGYCYNTKCLSLNGTYIECDSEFNTCTPGQSPATLAECSPGQSSGEFSFWCGQNEQCYHVEYTGKAYCGALNRSFLQLYWRYVLAGAVQAVGVGLILGTCYCFWLQCWKHRLGGRYAALLETEL